MHFWGVLALEVDNGTPLRTLVPDLTVTGVTADGVATGPGPQLMLWVHSSSSTVAIFVLDETERTLETAVVGPYRLMISSGAQGGGTLVDVDAVLLVVGFNS